MMTAAESVLIIGLIFGFYAAKKKETSPVLEKKESLRMNLLCFTSGDIFGCRSHLPRSGCPRRSGSASFNC